MVLRPLTEDDVEGRGLLLVLLSPAAVESGVDPDRIL